MASLLLKGEDIRRARKARGMTQAEAARSLGTTRSAVSRWESDRARPSAENARRMAAWLQAGQVEPVKDRVERVRRPTVKVAVAVPSRLAQFAEEVSADLPALLNTLGLDAVRAELKRLWSEQNAEAIKARNAYFEIHGLPLEKYRTW